MIGVKMKLNNGTVEVLKNFSTINPNLVIKSGTTITTMSALKNIMATAEVVDEFPTDFAIYDLNEFLAALSLFDKPDLEFSEKYVVLSDENGSTLKYWFSDPSVVTTPNKLITMPSVDVSFKFNSQLLSSVQKAASVIGAPDMALTSIRGADEGKKAVIEVTDRKNDNAHDFAVMVDVEQEENTQYKFWFKVENLKLLPGTYSVDVSSKKISHFKNDKFPVEYFIALEPVSTYNE